MKLPAIVLTLLLASVNVFSANTNITLNENNHVLLRNDVNDDTIAKLSNQLSTLVSNRGTKNYTIYLVLDSPGGSIDAGLNFIEFAKTIPNLETITIFSASMAAGIVEALPGKRNILSSGILMFHRASGGVEGQFESGELESRLDFYKRLVRSMEVTNAQRMSLNLESYKAKVKDELWILGTEAVSQKAADAEVNIVCSESLINKSLIESFNIMGLFTVQVKFSSCPLIRGGTVVDAGQKALYNQYKRERLPANKK